jgi:hypothetical protein
MRNNRSASWIISASLNWIRETDRSVTGWIFEGADGAGEQFHRRDLLTTVCARIGE